MAGHEERAREYEEALEKLENLRIASLKELWLEYDRQNDILYLNFGREEPDEELMLDDDVVVALKGDKIISISIYNFTKRIGL